MEATIQSAYFFLHKGLLIVSRLAKIKIEQKEYFINASCYSNFAAKIILKHNSQITHP